jgi:transcriptional regulator with XRE-family HTH domain
VAKSKWPQVKDKLILVEKWARDGLTEEQICKNLGISRQTLNEYKKTHSDLVDALKKGKEVFITEIENALSKSALGYEYEEVKTYIKDEDGKVVKYTEKTKKHQPPNVGACAFLLKNKDRGNWSDNPMKLEIERELLELQKKAQGMKVW